MGAGGTSGGNQGTPGKIAPPGATSSAPSNESKVTAASISTTISLLSTLCRGSPSITHVSFTIQLFKILLIELFQILVKQI